MSSSPGSDSWSDIGRLNQYGILIGDIASDYALKDLPLHGIIAELSNTASMIITTLSRLIHALFSDVHRIFEYTTP